MCRELLSQAVELIGPKRIMLKLLLGDPNARKLKRYQPIVSDINLLEEEFAPLSDDQLRGKTAEFQERLANAGSLASQPAAHPR